jgi:hypothetical protein
MRYLFIASLTLALSACSLSNSSTENEIGLSKKQLKEVAIIGDVGNKDGSLFSTDIHSNSFESIEMALKASNGVQIDIQISKDSTLWLFGEEKIRDCKFQKFKSLSEYNDGQIKFASTCWYEKQLIPLDSFIYLMDSLSFNDKIISLDLQSISDPTAIKRFGGEENLAQIMAQKLEELNQLENLTFIAELPSTNAIKAFEKQSNFTPYLRINEQSILDIYPRLSIPLLRLNEINTKQVETFQLHGANTANQLIEGIKSGAQIIQTSDLAMATFIQKSSDLQSKIIAKDSLSKNESDTLFSAILTEDQISKDFMLQLTVSKEVNLTQATLYIQGFNEDGHQVIWEGVGMQKKNTSYWKFFNAEELKEKGCTQILVYIWSQNLTEIETIRIQLRQLFK